MNILSCMNNAMGISIIIQFGFFSVGIDGFLVYLQMIRRMIKFNGIFICFATAVYC